MIWAATLLDDVPDFPPEELATRALLRRIDTKFLCATSKLSDLIPALGGEYGLLRAGGHSVARYSTLYFDTADRRFYHQHRRGRRDRFKVRIRHYLDRALSMLEIKRKSNHGVTSKSRRPHEFADHELSLDDRAFLARRMPCKTDNVEPQIWTDFRRITLVGLATEERLTIDFGLEFVAGRMRHPLPGLAIVEVKQPHFQPRSTAMLALRGLGTRRSRMSKYCIGQATLSPELRQNRFRRTLRKVRRICRV